MLHVKIHFGRCKSFLGKTNIVVTWVVVGNIRFHVDEFHGHFVCIFRYSNEHCSSIFGSFILKNATNKLINWFVKFKYFPFKKKKPSLFIFNDGIFMLIWYNEWFLYNCYLFHNSTNELIRFGTFFVRGRSCYKRWIFFNYFDKNRLTSTANVLVKLLENTKVIRFY